MQFRFPSIEFLASAYVMGMVLLMISAILFRNHIRINGAPSWLLYALVGPVPVLFCVTLAGILMMPTNAALFSVSVAALVGTMWCHWFLPALIPDFQTENLSVSCVLGFLLGVCVLVAGTVTNTFPAGLMAQQEDAFGKTSETWQEGKLP